MQLGNRLIATPVKLENLQPIYNWKNKYAVKIIVNIYTFQPVVQDE
jgi:hypothetical protein